MDTQHAGGAGAPEYIVEIRGTNMRVGCHTVEQVVETVRALSDREVPRAVSAEPRPVERLEIVGANPVATAMYDLFRETPQWRRPVDILKALRKRRVHAKYNNVYAVLRYGDFKKRDGRWNLADA